MGIEWVTPGVFNPEDLSWKGHTSRIAPWNTLSVAAIGNALSNLSVTRRKQAETSLAISAAFSRKAKLEPSVLLKTAKMSVVR